MNRRWLFWILIIAMVWLAVSRFTDLQQLAQTLIEGQWQWVMAAAACQLLYYLLYAGLYQAAFATVEVESRLLDLVPVMFASFFLGVAAPSGGLSGAALFVDDAVRRKQSASRAAAGFLLVTAAEMGVFALILAIGMVSLFRRHDLQTYEVLAAVGLLAFTGALAGVLMVGLWRPAAVEGLLKWVQHFVERIGRRIRREHLLPDGWAERQAAGFTSAAQAIAAHPGRLARTLCIALLMFVADIAALYALFLAFHEPVGFGVLVAGFAIGFLFTVVAITPMGLGVVEGVMALVYTSLGVPADRAAVITLSFRGLSFWLPLAIGFLLLRRVKSLGAQEHSRSDVWSVRIVALLTALMGVVNVLSAITPALPERMAALEQVLPLAVRHGGHLTAALAGFALLLLAVNLWRRKRAAWVLTIAVLVISAVSHLVKGLDVEEASLALALAAWLFVLRSHFYARSDAPSIAHGTRVLVAAALFTLAYGIAGFYLLDRAFTVNFDFPSALRQTVMMFTQFADPGLQPITRFGRYFAGSIYVVAALSGAYALLMLFQPVLVRQPASPGDRNRARAIIEAHGRTSLAPFALLDDKSYYFSPGGSVVAYVAKGRVGLSLGDPIGPPDDLAGAIAGFQAFCPHNDWLPAFYQVHPEGLPAYRAAGFDAVCVGCEAIVDLGEFTLDGKQGKRFRRTMRLLEDAGYRAEVHPPPQPDAFLRELRVVSDEWLSLVHGAEKRFSLGWFHDAYLRGCPIMAVHDTEGTVMAFANVLSEFQLSEVTIDLMRHRPNVEEGTMEFLMASLLLWAKAQGCASFNLGLSSLAGVGQQPTDPALERGLHYIYEHVDQFYNFQGLHVFKSKFHPAWSPRYVIYPGPASVVPVALAMIRADSGDNFVRDFLVERFGKKS